MKIDLAQYTYRVEDWAGDVASLQKQAIQQSATSDYHYGKQLGDSLKEKVKSRGGLPDKITFQFERHGVFYAIGVSKGYTIQQKGSGIVVKTGPGEFKRKKVNWFSDPLKTKMDSLEQIIAEEHARIASDGLALGISSLTIRGLE